MHSDLKKDFVHRNNNTTENNNKVVLFYPPPLSVSVSDLHLPYQVPKETHHRQSMIIKVRLTRARPKPKRVENSNEYGNSNVADSLSSIFTF